MPDKTKLDWALQYAEQGLHVFPVYFVLKDGGCSCHKGDCGRIGKHPATKNGVLDATTDPDQIRRWWAKNKNYNIGIATGHDGLVVIDADTGVDERDRRVKQGPENLAKLQAEHGTLPPTLQQRTGSGGVHYLFRSDKPIKNDNTGKVAQDVDVRGKSGYVVVPPSNHKSGGHYEWLNEGAPIAPMPEWLETLCPQEPVAPKVDASQDAAPSFDDKDLLKGATKDEVRKLLRVIPADDRDTWWKIGAALKTEYGDDGFDIWDEWSRTSDKYQANVQKVQWQSFRPGEISAGTIFHFAKENGWHGFDAQTADEATFRENWVYVVGIKRFIELNTMQELDKEQFSAKFAHCFKRGQAAEHVLRSEHFPKLDAVTYWPDQPQIVDENKLRKLNLWQPSGVNPTPGDVTPFLNHVQYLFPEESEQKIILDYLAFQVQRPGRKIHYALLLQGDQGNGKSYFAEVAKQVLGPHNVKMVTSDILHETFTGWQKAAQFVVVEELMTNGRRELMNKLKPMITEPWCSIREMYKPPYEQPNRFNFLFLTNYEDSIILDKTDRRYCVLHSPAPPHSDGPSYYQALFDWTGEHPGALLQFLRSRDLSNFNPRGHAPMTTAKQTVITNSMSPLEEFIVTGIEEMTFPFKTDLVCISHLKSEEVPILPPNLRKSHERFFAQALVRAGAKQIMSPTNLNEPRRFWLNDGSRAKLWMIRNHDVWSVADEKDVVAEYERFMSHRRPGGEGAETPLSAQRSW